MPEIPPEDHERLRSLAFNAVTRVTVEVDRFVALSERRTIADGVLADVLSEHEVMVRRQVTIENDADSQVCPRCRFPEWMHDLWKCVPHHMAEFVGDDELRRDVVLRELNEGALSGMDSQVSERAADLILAALNRYDAWKAANHV